MMFFKLHNMKYISRAMLVGLMVCLSGTCKASSGETVLDIESKLFALKPLPKIHYSFSLNSNLINDRNSRLLYELARITHSLSVIGRACTQDQIDNCIYTCERINKTKPAIENSLALNFTPWHYRFGKDLPPTDKGPTYESEINFFRDRLKLIKKWVAEGNKKYSSDIKVGAILLDTEVFVARKNDPVYNEAMRQKLDDIDIIARTIFQKSRIIWFGRGVKRVWGGDGWGRSRYFTGKEVTTTLTCALYTVPEIERTRETYRRTCKLADQMGIKEVMPWVALAAGYRRGLKEKPEVWDFDWRYDLIYSYQIGAELNKPWYGNRPERYAPYNRSKIISFYPSPFDVRTPKWTDHFIAYVRGATGVKDLKDLGYDK